MGAAHRVAQGAVLRNHQWQAAVDDGLAGQVFGHVPYLLVPQLKGHRGALQPQALQKEQSAGIEHVEAEVTQQVQIQPLGDGQMAQVADGHTVETLGVLQQGAQAPLVRRAVNPGQHGAEFLPRPGGQVHCIQPVHGNIHDFRRRGQQFFRQLGPVRQGDRQLRRGCHSRAGGQGGFRGGAPWGRGRHGVGQRVQSVPPQAVDGPGGQHEPVLHRQVKGRHGEHGAAGLAQPLAQFLRRQAAVSRRLRHGADDGDGVFAPLRRQRGGGVCRQVAGEGHRGEPVLPALDLLPHLGKPILGPPGLFAAHAQHIRSLFAPKIAVGEAVPVKGVE